MRISKRRPLKRYFNVTLSENETNNLEQYSTEKVGYEFLRGAPRLIKKKNGKYVAKIFRRFGPTQGSYTTIAKIQFTGQHDLKVVIKSAVAVGYFMLTMCVGFAVSLVALLLSPDFVDEENLNLWALVFGVVVFGFMSWVFLGRYMREPDLELMETYLKEKLGGEWRDRS